MSQPKFLEQKKKFAYRADKLDVEELPEGWWSEIPGWMAASLSASLKLK